MNIYLFPLSHPDELHASQASRYHNDSGNVSARISYRELYGSPPFRLTYWVPLHLERFAEKLSEPQRGKVENLLRHNTLYPLFETFCNARLDASDESIPVANQIANMPKRIVGESGEIHLCVECLREDREQFGQPYIHRSHQIPGAQVCWRHETRLLSCCPNCGCPFEQKGDFVLAPWEPCEGCGLNLLDASFYKSGRDASPQEIRFARFGREMLLSRTRALSPELLACIYKSRLLEIGFARGSRLDQVAILDALEAHYGQAGLAQMDAAYREQRTQQWFRLCIASSVLDVPLSRHLILANFLFESAEQFWKYAEQVEATTPGSVEAPAPETPAEALSSATSSSAPSVIVTTALDQGAAMPPVYNQLEKILLENPNWGEKELWREYPGLMKKFVRHDGNAMSMLREYLAAPTSRSLAKDETQIILHNPKDVLWAQAFVKSANALYLSVDRPKHITRNFLMRAAGWKPLSMPCPTRLPTARQQLEVNKESNWHFYARRILWTILQKNETNLPRRGVLDSSGIEHHQGLAVLNHFSAVSGDVILGPGVIMEILKSYEIDKDWCGPAQGVTFLRPGRKSTHGGRFAE